MNGSSDGGFEWWAYKVFLPAIVILSSWPVYAFVAQATSSFSRAFSQGDFLILGALMLLDLHLEATAGVKDRPERRKVCAMLLVAGLAFMLAVGILKAVVARQTEPSLAAAAVCLGGFALAGAAGVYWASYKKRESDSELIVQRRQISRD